MECNAKPSGCQAGPSVNVKPIVGTSVTTAEPTMSLKVAAMGVGLGVGVGVGVAVGAGDGLGEGVGDTEAEDSVFIRHEFNATSKHKNQIDLITF